MMKYGEKFEKNFRKGAQIMAFSKKNFFFDHPLLVSWISTSDEAHLRNLEQFHRYSGLDFNGQGLNSFTKGLFRVEMNLAH